MKLSIFDNNFNNSESLQYPFEKRADYVKNLGYTGIHWSYPDGNNEYMEMYRPNGLAATSIDVLVRLTAADDEIFDEALDVAFKSLEFAAKIGCDNAMMVPWNTEDINGEEDRQRARERMIEGLKLITAEAKKYGVRVSIENFSNPFLPFSLIDDIRYILDSVEDLYFTFDTGNFVCAGEDGVKAYHTLKDRIIMMHLKEFGEVEGPGDRVICRKSDGKYLYGVKFGEGLAKLDEILRLAAKDFPDIWYEVEHHYFELTWKDIDEITEYLRDHFK